VGNISTNEQWIVTSAGTWPIVDVNITSVDQTSTTTHTPAWAIVIIVLFLSLLFLLARETRLAGYFTVHVSAANGQSYTEQVAVHNALQRGGVGGALENWTVSALET
jgi:hypothetical protein